MKKMKKPFKMSKKAQKKAEKYAREHNNYDQGYAYRPPPPPMGYDQRYYH